LAIREGLNVYLNSTGSRICFDWSSGGGSLSENPITELVPWLYQTCTQYVHPMAGTGFFALPHDRWSQEGVQRYCQTQYPGSVWDPLPTILTVNQTSLGFSKVLLYVGGYDPTKSLQPKSSLSSDVLVQTAFEGAHCVDIMMPRPSDPEWLLKTRMQEISILKLWLA
jgi:hypothetical protein